MPTTTLHNTDPLKSTAKQTAAAPVAAIPHNSTGNQQQQVSENTKLLSDQLKEQFAQKYNNIFLSIDQKDYNPLDNLRKRLSAARSESIYSANSPGSLSVSSNGNGHRRKPSPWRLKPEELAAHHTDIVQITSPPPDQLRDRRDEAQPNQSSPDNNNNERESTTLLQLQVPPSSSTGPRSTTDVSERSSSSGSDDDDDESCNSAVVLAISAAPNKESHRRGQSLGLARSDESLTDGATGPTTGAISASTRGGVTNAKNSSRKISRFKEKLKATIRRGESRGSDLVRTIFIQNHA
jgi:hypothetical protein